VAEKALVMSVSYPVLPALSLCSREVSRSLFMLRLFFRQKSRKRDDVCIDLLGAAWAFCLCHLR